MIVYEESFYKFLFLFYFSLLSRLYLSSDFVCLIFFYDVFFDFVSVSDVILWFWLCFFNYDFMLVSAFCFFLFHFVFRLFSGFVCCRIVFFFRTSFFCRRAFS